GRLQGRPGALDVHQVGVARIGGDGIDVGDRGEMDDRVAAAHRGVERLRVEQVADDGLDVAVRVRRSNEVEDARRVALAPESVDDVRADEPRSTGDEDAHPRIVSGGAAVVEGNAPVVLRDPVGVGQVDATAGDAVAGLVVDLSGRPLDGLEDDVFVETRDHPVGKLDAGRVLRVEVLARHGVLPGGDLVETRYLRQADGARELVHAEVHAGDAVVGLTVVAKRARELDDVGPAGDEHPALTGR